MAQSAVVGLLRVLLTANTAEFNSAMKSASDSAQQWSRELRTTGRQAQDAGLAITKIFAPVAVAMGGAVKVAMDFESSFANVAKTVDGVSDSSGVLTEKGKALASTFRQMAKEIPATTDELNAIAALGGQMGVPIDQLEKFTRNVSALGVAVDGISAEEAAAGLAQIGNIFGEGTKNVDKMASSLVHLGNSSNATEGDILEFTKRLSGAGNAVGMTIPEVMALGTAMANVGINAEAGGTAMSMMITKVSKAVSTGGASLEAFAKVAEMSAAQFTETWKRSPVEAMDAIIQGLGRAKDRGEDLNIVVGKIGATNIRTADTMKRLAGAGDGVARSLDIANEGFSAGNKHLEEAEKKYATTANQLKLLWNHIRDVGMTIGNALLPAVRTAIDMAGSLVVVVDLLAKAFSVLPGPVMALVVGLGLAVVAAGPLLIVLGHLITSAAAVTAAFGAKGVATRLLAAHIGTLAGAYKVLATPITLTTAGLAANAGAMTISTAATRTLTGAKVLLTGATRTLYATLLAHPFVAVTAAIGAATVALTGYYEASKRRELQAQTEGAKQDTINLAIQRGAAHLSDITDKTKQYTAAIEYNDHWMAIRRAQFDKSAEAQKRSLTAQLALVEIEVKAGRITQEQANLRQQQIRAELQVAAVRRSNVGLAETIAIHEKKIRDEIAATGMSVQQLVTHLKKSPEGFKVWATANNLSADAQKYLQDQIKSTTAAIKASEKPLNDFVSKTKELETRLRQAEAAGVPMVIVLEEYKSQIEDVSNKHPIFAQAAKQAGKSIASIGEATQRAADALKKAELAKAVEKALNEAHETARTMAERLLKDQQDAVKDSLETSNRVYSSVLDSQLSALRENLQLRDDAELDSLQKRLNAVHRHYDLQRMELRSRTGDHSEALEIINENERLASEAATQAWNRHFAELRREANTIPNIFLNALQSVPAVIHQALTGGGGLSGALGAVLSGIGGQLGGKLFGRFAQSLSGTLWKTLGADITSVLGKVIPGIGAALGAVVGPMLGKLFNKLFGTAGRDAVREFGEQFGGLDNLREKLTELGDEGERLWIQLTQRTGRNNPEQAAEHIRQVTEALEKHEQQVRETRDEMSRLTQEGGLASRGILEFRDATRESAETMAFIKSETQAAGHGFTEFLQAGATAYTKLADLKKQFADKETSDEDRRTLAAEIEKQEKLIAAIGIAAPKSALASVRAAMNPYEVAALAEGYQVALREGFQGTQDEFLRQQLDFYNVLEEGDERLKTWFSGATIDAFNAGAQKRLDAARAAMSTEELRALSDGYQAALLDGFKGTQDEFLRQQLDLYAVLEEGDDRLKTWFSGATLDAYQQERAVTSAATALGSAIAGVYGELVSQGMSARDALREVEPGIAALRIQLDATGQSGGAAFEHLAALATVAGHEIAGPALDAINQLSRGLQGAHNAGFLTQEMFEGLVGQIMHSRQAILDQGVASEHVNSLMQRDLQTIWQLQRDFNFEVDDATQTLLDEAEAAGTVGDQYRSAMDRAAIAMERVADALESIFGKAKQVGDELGKIPRQINVDVNYSENNIPRPPSEMTEEEARAWLENRPEHEFAARGGIVTAMGRIQPARHMDEGGLVRFKAKGTDTVPAMLTPGEGVVTTSGMNVLGEEGLAAINAGMNWVARGGMQASMASSAATMPAPVSTTDQRVTVNINRGAFEGVIVDGRERTRQLARAIFAEARREPELQRDFSRIPRREGV